MTLPMPMWRYCSCGCDYWHSVSGHSVACPAAIVQLTGATVPAPYIPPGGRACPNCLDIVEHEDEQALRNVRRRFADAHPDLIAGLDAILAEEQRAITEQGGTDSGEGPDETRPP
ncbi:hypothetical protein [Actinocrispum wychmicini]|uniref:Uncharacterized protein n=1 Tax=Actinocrispum wychmicini TaxID=1213861 RepID=A0A4R2JSF5_9PSEU|nr:hypothetical protein [Actinocrispum wychmicini]TCO57105.1 hypothetical protein EV192_106582 [Actinocrispum wychmicini]